MAADNPFTLVYDTLWKMANSHPTFAALVLPGNQIAFSSATNRSPEKDTIQAADVPEVMLLSEGMVANIYSNSTGSNTTRRYSWLISTGDQRIHELLHQVEWALFCAMHTWKTKLDALTYNGYKFCKQCKIADVSNFRVNAEQNRNLRGWAALWRCEVEMHFRSQDLLDETE